jgi:hypothetical protein
MFAFQTILLSMPHPFTPLAQTPRDPLQMVTDGTAMTR